MCESVKYVTDNSLQYRHCNLQQLRGFWYLFLLLFFFFFFFFRILKLTGVGVKVYIDRFCIKEQKKI